MRRLHLLLILALVGGALTACREQVPAPSEPARDGALGPFDWPRDPGALVVRLDSYDETKSPAYRLNQVPPCTIWGDGRVVWTSRNPATGEDVLEARVDEAALRGFIESLIGRGFYSWADNVIPPEEDSGLLETITLALYGDVHAVRRYSSWPQNSYARLLEECRRLSAAPVLVMPAAGWVSVYPITLDPMLPSWPWPPRAPFTLREWAASGEARWIEGDLATAIWQSARETGGSMQVIERGGGAYELAIVVPGYSRDGPVSTLE